jgi:hypothetical protein
MRTTTKAKCDELGEGPAQSLSTATPEEINDLHRHKFGDRGVTAARDAAAIAAPGSIRAVQLGNVRTGRTSRRRL